MAGEFPEQMTLKEIVISKNLTDWHLVISRDGAGQHRPACFLMPAKKALDMGEYLAAKDTGKEAVDGMLGGAFSISPVAGDLHKALVTWEAGDIVRIVLVGENRFTTEKLDVSDHMAEGMRQLAHRIAMFDVVAVDGLTAGQT
jgi:hypothetical protein